MYGFVKSENFRPISKLDFQKESNFLDNPPSIVSLSGCCSQASILSQLRGASLLVAWSSYMFACAWWLLGSIWTYVIWPLLEGNLCSERKLVYIWVPFSHASHLYNVNTCTCLDIMLKFTWVKGGLGIMGWKCDPVWDALYEASGCIMDPQKQRGLREA